MAQAFEHSDGDFDVGLGGGLSGGGGGVRSCVGMRWIRCLTMWGHYGCEDGDVIIVICERRGGLEVSDGGGEVKVFDFWPVFWEACESCNWNVKLDACSSFNNLMCKELRRTTADLTAK